MRKLEAQLKGERVTLECKIAKYEVLKSVIDLSMKTLEIIKNLPKLHHFKDVILCISNHLSLGNRNQFQRVSF